MQSCQCFACMEEVLVNQFVGFEFTNKCVYSDCSAFIQPKLQIYPVVCHRTIHNVVVVV